ncbi:poly(3-hydroxyalkanoate) depolymerase [Streptomyces sp. NPDC001514]
MGGSVHFVMVGRRRLRVAVRPGTDADRPPLLLCNGIGASLDLLDPFVDALDPAIEVIRFDPPGVGGSPVPQLPYPFPALARLVGRLLDTLGHDRFDVLGISWGGGLAQQLALQNPRRCRQLVLVSTATGWMMVPAHPRVLGHMATPRRYWDADYVRAIAGRIYGGRLRDQPDLVQKLLLDFERKLSARGYLYQLASGAGWTSTPFLPLIRQPTLILAGDDDPIIPLVNARMMARLIPRAQLHVYPDGHLGLLTMRDELAAVVAEFLGVTPGTTVGRRRRRTQRRGAG